MTLPRVHLLYPNIDLQSSCMWLYIFLFIGDRGSTVTEKGLHGRMQLIFIIIIEIRREYVSCHV